MDRHIENGNNCQQEQPVDTSRVNFKLCSQASVASTKELLETDSVREKYFRKMSCPSSRKLFVAIICVLSIGILTTTSLLILQYRKKLANVSEMNKKNALVIECLRRAPDVTLTTIPPEVKTAFSSLENEIKSQATAMGIKAGSLAVVYNGKLWWTFHFGSMNYSNPKSSPPNDNTPYPIASVTKLFTAVMLHKLIEDGLIKSIDDTVKSYNKQFSIKNPFNNEHITFRQLLCMTAALPREAPCYPAETHNLCPYNNSEMWKRMSKISLQRRPNTLPSYSNLGFAILGRVMANITQEANYERWMQKKILDPLAMSNSGFNPTKRAADIPLSTNPDQSIARIMDWGWLNPAAGLYSTITDLNKFTSLLMDFSNSTLLKLYSKRRLFQIDDLYQFTSDTLAYGCPFVVTKSQTAEKEISKKVKKKLYQKLFLRNGNTFGYYSNIILSPDMKLAIISLSANEDAYRNKIPQMTLKTIIPIFDKVLRKNATKYKAPSNMDAYVGRYRVTSYWPMISKPATVTKENGKLIIYIETFKAALTYVRPWVLKTMYYESEACKEALTASGLYSDFYYFESPKPGTNTCPSFFMDGISSTGHTAFKRI